MLELNSSAQRPSCKEQAIRILRVFPASRFSMVLPLLLLEAVALGGCRDSPAVIPRSGIRQLNFLSDLNSSQHVDAGKKVDLEPVTALEAKEFADAQAKLWNRMASLIHVKSATFIVKSSGPIEIGGWLFVYQNRDNEPLLGVLAGSTGVLDVGTTRVTPSDISGWLPIPDWTVDSDYSALHFTAEGPGYRVASSDLALYGVMVDGRILSVWRASTTFVVVSRLIDAHDGRTLDGEGGTPSIASQIEEREALD